MPAKPTTIDEFLSRLDHDKRAALQKLRRDIHAAAPGVEEVISYGTAGFKLDGRLLVWFGAGANHCSFFPGALPIARCASELTGYETSKGTVRFSPETPLPATLVARLVQVRVAENADRSAKTAAKRSKAKKSTAKRGAAKRAAVKKSATKRPPKGATARRSARKRAASGRSAGTRSPKGR